MKQVVVGMNLRKRIILNHVGAFKKNWAANALTTMNTTHGKSYTKEYKTYECYSI